MNSLPFSIRLTAALSAVVTTLSLFSAVLSNSEPQRGELMARNAPVKSLPADPTKVVVALNDKVKRTK